jgi:murein DD-endopeptidase MepM/ murein hydrolase activator NlpD
MSKPFAKGFQFIRNLRACSSIFSIALLCLLTACGSSAVRAPDSDHNPEIVVESESGVSASKVVNHTSVHAGLFEWPVDRARLTRGFLPKTRTRHRAHYGIDLAAPKGTPIYAAQDGVVIYVGTGFTGYGRMIMIEGKEGFATLYAHLSKFGTHEGARVVKGQAIGAMGRTGRASGNHLHFEIRKDKGPIDPLIYLPSTSIPGTKSARRQD